MGFMIFFFIFLLTKKIVSYTKYCILILVYLFIFYCVVILIFCDDFIYFMILFESLFFPICFISLFFCFNNRFIFAIYYLIIFSSLSSVLCISICLIIILHFNTLNLNFFSDICFFDSLYLNIFI